MITRIFKKISNIVWYISNRRKFAFLSSSVWLQKNIRIDGEDGIELQDGVVIQRGSWIASVPLTGKDSSLLRIGANTVIGNYNHIYATSSIIIENDVLTADKVYISDCSHSYEDVNIPIIKQQIKQLSNIVIGRGAWIGENVCIIGASVGRNSVIGANSVVTHNIPDYCVAVGIPARVIKKYNFNTQKWEKVE